MASVRPKNTIRRLMKDRQELVQFPVENVSAAPLESDMFEWHCNIQQDKDTIYHVILFFPNDYPYSSPCAEFVPTGLRYNGGAIKQGKKGDQICLNIFSDFGFAHTEWATAKGDGWSPGYTAQTILLNVVSFLAEYSGDRDHTYRKQCQDFKCPDCGHTFRKPFPSLNIVETKDGTSDKKTQDDSVSSSVLQIVDYVWKERFDSRETSFENGLFGYGLVLTQRGRKSMLTTPCEFLTSDTFYNMKRSNGVVHSIMKEELRYFMPLYVNNVHGSKIRKEFEKMLNDVKHVLFPQGIAKCDVDHVDVILQLIPNLMCSTVVEFSKGSTHTSENSLQGYFALHRLFIWAMEMYPELEKRVENRLAAFVTNPQHRTKDSCPDIGQWLMLLSVSKRFTWPSVSQAYLVECFRRNVMWYIQTDGNLGYIYMLRDDRLQKTFKHTNVSRNLLAFQVAFLKIAKPDTLSMEQIVTRYEANLGFPNNEMINEMKKVFQKINSEITNFEEWYNFLGLEYPSDASLFETLKDSVIYAKGTKGYHFSPNRSRR